MSNFFILLIGILFYSWGLEKTENWDIDNLNEIGGHVVTVFGNPKVVDTEIGKAVKFDGDGDMLLVDFNPIAKTNEFTIEVVFKQEASFPLNIAPRFIHIQDPDDSEAKRIMIELRVNENNKCYLDGFMRTNKGSLVLIDKKLVHPTEEWLHAALVYKNHVLTTYINGEKQLTGEIGFETMLVNSKAKVAIGGRMNQVSWFKGLIKQLKITQAAIEPEQFIEIK